MDSSANEGLILDLTRAISPVLEGRDPNTVVNAMTDLTLSVIMYAHRCSKPEAFATMANLLKSATPISH